MFEVGFTEILLILGLALLVLGPEKLPALAEKVGRWTGRARAMARQLRTQLEHEVTMEELTRSRPMQPPPPPPDASHTADASAPHTSPETTVPVAPEAASSETLVHAEPDADVNRAVAAPESPTHAMNDGVSHDIASPDVPDQGAPAEPAGTHDDKVAAQ